jgi:hypothetical protein
MNNFHYHQDPMYAAAAAILTGKTQLQESDTLDEAIDWNLIQSMYVKDIIDIVAALVIGGGIGIAALLMQRLRNYLSDKADERDAKESAQLLKSTLDKILKDSKSKELISQIKSFPYSSKSTEEAKKNNEERKKLVRAYSARLKTLLSDDEYALINDIYNNTIRESVETLDEGVEDVKAIVDTLKVGDLTNFGKVLEIGTNSITFKAKDLPKTTIAFNQRKMGSSEFLLLKTIKLKEETELTINLSNTNINEKDLIPKYDPKKWYAYFGTRIVGPYDSEKEAYYDTKGDVKWIKQGKDLLNKESLEEETDYTRFKQLATLGLVDSGELPKIITAMKAVESGKTISQSQKDLIASTFMALIGIITGDASTLGKLKQSLKSVNEAYKPLRKPADLIDELQSIVDAPDSKLWDVTSVSIRLSHEDIFDRFPKIYDYVEDMWFEIMQPNGAKKTKEIAKKAIEAVRKYYPDLNKSQRSNPVYKEDSIEEETIDEAINWLGDYLTTSEKSQFGGYRPTILDKKTKRVMYQSAAAYNTPQEAKDHAEDYLKQKAKGIRDPKVPVVGTYKRENKNKNKNHNGTFGLNHRPSFSDSDDYGLFGWLGETDEKMDEAADAALKRRKQVDMARVNAGVMSRDDYNKKYKLGKYRPAGSKLSGPGGVYKNLVKEEETLEEAVPTPAIQKLIAKIDEMSPKDYLVFLQALADNAQGISNMSRPVNAPGMPDKNTSVYSNAKAWAAVADHISAAADAYAKRPIRMEDTEVQGETLEEGANDKYNENIFALGKKLGLTDSQIIKLIVGSLKAHNYQPLKAKGNLTSALDSTLSANSAKQKALLKFADAGDYESLYNAIFEGTEVEGETLEEAAKITPVKGKYIFFIQDRELYQLDPYKMLAKTDSDRIAHDKLMSYVKLGSDWKAVSVAWGTDLLEIGALESPKDISDAEQWYVVNSSYKGITHLALVH